jgi:hypothetical protein
MDLGAIMSDKNQIISMLREEFERWENILGGLSEEQISAPNRIAQLSIKDIVAHLMAWQQRSIARMEAGLDNREPVFPKWPEGVDPEVEDVDQINAWIYQTYCDQPWQSVHEAWREGFLHFLELAEAIPEKDLMEVGRYAWLKDYALSAVLLGSYEHHHEEHLEPLLASLHQNEKL